MLASLRVATALVSWPNVFCTRAPFGTKAWSGAGSTRLFENSVSVTSARRQVLLPSKLALAAVISERRRKLVSNSYRLTPTSWPSARNWRTLKKREPVTGPLTPSLCTMSLVHIPERNSCDTAAPFALSLSRSASGAVRGVISSPNTKVISTNTMPTLRTIQAAIRVDMLEARMMVNSELAANCAIV